MTKRNTKGSEKQGAFKASKKKIDGKWSTLGAKEMSIRIPPKRHGEHSNANLAPPCVLHQLKPVSDEFET